MNYQRRQYPFAEFEPKWQARWLEAGVFRAKDPGEEGFRSDQPKYYILDMFPYPSGEGLHIGHPLQKTACDIIARKKRMEGTNVLFPAGWDSFGLPAEQYAMKTGKHPAQTTAQNIANFKRQLNMLGFSYDWSREVATSDPDYYHWTQWIFLKLYESYVDAASGTARPISELPIPEEVREAGPDAIAEFIDDHRLAYVAEAPVNWSPDLNTVLANEEVEEWVGKGFTVERRPMRQWMLRITAYAQRLLDDLSLLDWPESLKSMQRNWIGRSEGAEVRFSTEAGDDVITVFTTRPDTLFGATYMVLAPEHPLVEKLTTPDCRAAVEAYKKAAASKSDLERTELAKEKSGAFTGASAINPVNRALIPIWIADYVLMGYGTGAIMAVPAHDERDWEFAAAHGLEIRKVVDGGEEGACFTGEGAAMNSANDEISLNGLPTLEAKETITNWLADRGEGASRIQYKLRDWLFSRQRYWGEPFPLIWEEGRHRPIAEHELPLVPPELDEYRPTGDGRPPLARARDWVELPDGKIRETNTMPQWAGSCWYYLRYLDPNNRDRLVDPEKEKYWMGPDGVDLYVGGVEHAVLHLLYARFWHKFLYDLNVVSTPEPFHRLVNQGLILGEDGQKMSKSRGNVLNPDDVVEEFGGDVLRCFEMFMGPLEQSKPWSQKGAEGIYRFLARVWRLVMAENQEGEWELSPDLAERDPSKEERRVLHATIKKVTKDIDAISFNTAISQLMICTNTLTASDTRPVSAIQVFLRILSPFAPHLADELWERLGEKYPGFDGWASQREWPEWQEEFLVEDEVEIVVQVNGKVRERTRVPKGAEDAVVEPIAKEAVAGSLDGKELVKTIIVRDKLVNFVVR